MRPATFTSKGVLFYAQCDRRHETTTKWKSVKNWLVVTIKAAYQLPTTIFSNTTHTNSLHPITFYVGSWACVLGVFVAGQEIEVCRNNKYDYSTHVGKVRPSTHLPPRRHKNKSFSTRAINHPSPSSYSVLTANGAHCSITSCLAHGQRQTSPFFFLSLVPTRAARECKSINKGVLSIKYNL